MRTNHFLSTHAHWLLRMAIVSVFFYHGVLKFMHPQGFAEMLPISYLEVVLVASSQVGGSLLLLLGGFSRKRWADLATRVGAALNIPVMIGAITLVHWGRWNFVPTESHPMGGMEFQVVLALLMIYVAVVGNPSADSIGARPTQSAYPPKADHRRHANLTPAA